MASAWIVNRPSATVMPSQPSATVVSNTQASTPTSYQNYGWYNGKQYVDGNWYDTPQQNTSSSTPSFDVPQPDYDAIRREYDPILEAFSNQEKSVRESEAEQEKMLDENLAYAQGKLSTNKTEREQYNREQELSLERQRDSALNEMMRQFRALEQQGRVRFGRGNSAGQAASEIAQQEYWRQQGNVNTTHIDNVGKIQADFRRYLSWHADEEQRLLLENKNAKTQLKAQVREALTTIGNNIAMTESERARAVRLERDKYNARLADINNQLKTQQMALDQYRQEVMIKLDAEMKLASQNRYAVADNTFANDIKQEIQGFSDKLNSSSINGFSNFNEADSFLLARAPRYAEDEFENNPYFT